ncbi:Sec-independent protein translocase TatB [Streptomyces carminius]|uniref:Sec-independent protein translocase protein TatB n=1 Tax=Streptomyces carminius TaxID=2665496 RepID=A0A2M8LWC2_9ACTN|nr:sec-independent translocase [Streptomyces carminius]PJE96199.1 Sec-independent protein translocase TatB [Streptomyces carminius]
MFFDIGPLELVALIILAVLVFGPEKLPKLIQDVAGFVRKVREFSDNAREDIRRELGPEFKDFEFEDLNPKNFARKHLLDNEDLGLKEIRNGFDLRQELAEVTDAVNSRESSAGTAAGAAAGTAAGAADSAAPAGGISLEKSSDGSADRPSGRPGSAAPADGTSLKKSSDGSPPFDADAT